jgi:hypothetical protein
VGYASAVCQSVYGGDILGGRTDRRNDALPDLTLETQIGLAQFGTFLTKLSNLGTLWRKKRVKRVAS